MPPLLKIPVFLHVEMAAFAVRVLDRDMIQGRMDAVLPNSTARDVGGSSVLVRSTSSSSLAGSLFWLDLNRYEEIVSRLDQWNSGVASRVLTEATVEPRQCAVKCWAYFG